MYSIIIPMYKAERQIPALLDALAALRGRLNDSLEAVFVLDGLADDSLAVLEKSLKPVPFQSIVLTHSRNFGSLAAIRSGLSRAHGEFFAIMSADLQEPPELLLSFFDSLSKNEADVVFGQRLRRRDPWVSQVLSNLFWTLYRRFIEPDIPRGGVDVFGCNSAFRARLLELYESHNVLIGTLYWLGFRRKVIPYERQPDRYGKSTWTFGRKFRYAIDNVLLYSDFPITLITLLGLTAVGASLLGGSYLFLTRTRSLNGCLRFAPELLIALFFAGVNAVGLGVLGAYLWRLMGSTRRWPQAVIAEERSHSVRNQQ